MSLFVETGQIDPAKNYLTELVGEGLKYKTNEDMARAVMEKDLHIGLIESENKKVRDALTTRVKEEDLYDRIKGLLEKSPSNTQNTIPDVNGTNNKAPDSNTGFTPEQIDELVNKKYQQLEQDRRAQTNLATVKEKLVEKFGTNYVSKLKEEADKLKMDEKALESIAQVNPSAFYRLVGIEGNAPGFSSLMSPPRSAVEGSFKPNTNNDRTESYYSELKKKDPVTYNSRAVQEQEYKDALRLGEAFFDQK